MRRIAAHYVRHDAWTDPGVHSAAVRTLGPRLESLTEGTRNLFVHSDYLRLYDLTAEDFETSSRTTLPLSERLDRVRGNDGRCLSKALEPADRQVGTCRDYAVVLCGLLREAGIAARVRCGFATYFLAGFYEDHWVTQYWDAKLARWQIADAQLDEVHCSHLGIDFDTTNLPDTAFLLADAAWSAYRGGSLRADLFGHGEAKGVEMLVVNLVRDHLALRRQLTSEWDSWRDSLPWTGTVSTDLVQLGDSLTVDSGVPKPFWSVAEGGRS